MNSRIVIPTYKRPESLAKTLDSILLGSSLPTTVLIIDDDALPDDFISKYRRLFSKAKVDFAYHKKDHVVHRKGLSESKNLGYELAVEDIVFYLDDDVVLDRDYVREIMNAWKNNKNDERLFAVGGRISNNRKQSRIEHAYYWLFGLKGDLAWDVNKVGFQCWDESVTEIQKAHYLHGGVSSYRTELLRQFGFAEFSGGRTGLEDVEIGLRTKQAGYHMLYVPSAQLAHYHEPSGRENAYESGAKESRNRKEIFRTLCEQSLANKLHFAWANIGWVLKKFLSGNVRYGIGMLNIKRT